MRNKAIFQFYNNVPWPQKSTVYPSHKKVEQSNFQPKYMRTNTRWYITFFTYLFCRVMSNHLQKVIRDKTTMRYYTNTQKNNTCDTIRLKIRIIYLIIYVFFFQLLIDTFIYVIVFTKDSL